VISSQDGKSILESHLQRHQQGDSLNRVVASVNIISHEEIVGVGWLSTNLEQFTQVVELSVDVTTDGHWCTYLLHVGFHN